MIIVSSADKRIVPFVPIESVDALASNKKVMTFSAIYHIVTSIAKYKVSSRSGAISPSKAIYSTVTCKNISRITRIIDYVGSRKLISST